MNPGVRNLFPWLAGTFALAAMVWAVSFGTLPRADFVFNNEDEVKTLDPSKAVGNPEHRILTALFEGLLRMMPAQRPPDERGVVPLEVVPGVAELPEISPDLKTYTFRLRPEAQWSNGDPVTAHDFAWSWRRTLHPDTASEYAYQLHYLVGAKQYQEGVVQIGERVEVELADRRDPTQPFPRGTLVRGVLRGIVKPPPPTIPADASEDERGRLQADHKQRWIYLVTELARGRDGEFATPWDATGRLTAFSPSPPSGVWRHDNAELPFAGTVEKVQNVLLDFESQVGVQAVDPRTLVVRLHSPTAFFSELTTFYPLFPSHRGCIEQYGSPAWTKPEHIVTNGPYLLQMRRIRDRIRLVKSPHYWDREHVRLNVIDALPLKSRLTGLNMFLNGELDWNHAPPGSMVQFLRGRPDYLQGPALISYFYRLNVERPGLKDKRVRQALNMAVDKQQICDAVTMAGETPARSFVPAGMPGYTSALCPPYAPEQARKLLAEAGYPGGRGFPTLQILFNSDEVHKSIAEVIQQQWKQNLGIHVDLRGIAWPAYLEQMHKIDFDLCRSGWVPDYTDPNTFLDMFVTGGLQNSTHWGHAEYDRLIRAAGSEADPQQRMAYFQQAEAILMDEMPIIPLYHYVTKNQVKPRVRGFYPNPQDMYPLYALSVEDTSATAGGSR